MITIIQNEIQTLITNQYLSSPNFNGLHLDDLIQQTKLEWTQIKPVLRDLIETKLIGLISFDDDVNPNIIRRGFGKTEGQISKLNNPKNGLFCLYPRPKLLSTIVDRMLYKNQPYKLELALGEAQLAYHSFDISVLETYRNDPRYYYKNDDIRGTISIHDKFLDSTEMIESSKILLKSFGFSHNKSHERAVSVFVCDLAKLSPEHQQTWKSRQLEGEYLLNPDYFRNNILGQIGLGTSICSAILKELYLINQMAIAMCRPKLFRIDAGEYLENRPEKFTLIVRPTAEEFNSFVHLLDKLFSENIDRNFFQKDVPFRKEVERNDGKIEVQNLGTIQILETWILQKFRLQEEELFTTCIKTFRKIRNLRQKPAHSIEGNDFDKKYFKKQQELLQGTYDAIRTLRLILANHPKVEKANITIPKTLIEGRIWSY